mmetsp:Transcript_2735/g.8192  ORF Transcript_2735/g.8192 Transcript_2735/m.8192 type:complete len:309 (+) Transcript_2735:1135-2061(+)
MALHQVRWYGHPVRHLRIAHVRRLAAVRKARRLSPPAALLESPGVDAVVLCVALYGLQQRRAHVVARLLVQQLANLLQLALGLHGLVLLLSRIGARAVGAACDMRVRVPAAPLEAVGAEARAARGAFERRAAVVLSKRKAAAGALEREDVLAHALREHRHARLRASRAARATSRVRALVTRCLSLLKVSPLFLARVLGGKLLLRGLPHGVRLLVHHARELEGGEALPAAAPAVAAVDSRALQAPARAPQRRALRGGCLLPEVPRAAVGAERVPRAARDARVARREAAEANDALQRGRHPRALAALLPP